MQNLIFFFIPSTVCLMFRTTLPALEMCGDKLLVVSGQIVPDSGKTWSGSELLLCVWVSFLKHKMKQDKTFLGKGEKWIQDAKQSLTPAVFPPLRDVG